MAIPLLFPCPVHSTPARSRSCSHVYSSFHFHTSTFTLSSIRVMRPHSSTFTFSSTRAFRSPLVPGGALVHALPCRPRSFLFPCVFPALTCVRSSVSSPSTLCLEYPHFDHFVPVGCGSSDSITRVYRSLSSVEKVPRSSPVPCVSAYGLVCV